MIADAQRAAAPGIDFAIMNNGGIRRDLDPGPLDYGVLFELQPFGNSIMAVRLTGAGLKEVLEHALASGAPDDHVSGLTVRYDPGKPRGERVLEMRKDDGTVIRADATYVLGVTDFLQTGGGGFAMLRTREATRTGKTDLDALIEYLRRLPQPVAAPAGRRFVVVAP